MWEALVDRYARYVHAIVTWVYRSEPADAEDVFQRSSPGLRAARHARDGAALRPWIA